MCLQDRSKIVFSGVGDHEPDLDCKEHPVFKRNASDLIMHMPLQLVEALCGYQKVSRL